MCEAVNSIPFYSFDLFSHGVIANIERWQLYLDSDQENPDPKDVSEMKLYLSNRHLICYYKDKKGIEGYHGTIEYVNNVAEDGTVDTELLATAKLSQEYFEGAVNFWITHPNRQRDKEGRENNA